MPGELSLEAGLLLARRYRLDVPIGAGAMGEVWRGVDLALNRPIAIKILPPQMARDENGVARFRREAESAAGLQHPGICTVFDIDTHDSVMFLVMELLQGSDLARVIAAHPGGLPIDQVVGLAEQITDALAVAHARGVVHRDIKPANLFLQQDGRVKVCDFGIARLADRTTLTATGGLIGTPRYMAPEEFRGVPADYRADLYAVGGVLYELFTGRPAFDADGDSGIASIMYKHLNEAPVPLRSHRPDIPVHLERLVLDLLAKPADHRPVSAAAVRDFLRRSGHTVVPRRPAAVPAPAAAYRGSSPGDDDGRHVLCHQDAEEQKGRRRRRRWRAGSGAGRSRGLRAAERLRWRRREVEDNGCGASVLHRTSDAPSGR
ncbi:serine/threonine-protein kinase [Actinoallomurus acanthiterrae]